MHHFVQPFEKIDSVQILAAAVTIGNPLARLARIVEIEHRSDRVHAQSVNVIFVQPEKRVGNQEVHHLIAAVVVNQRAPIGMRALARIGMFVKMRSVELRQPVRVARKMRGRPVEQHAEAGLVGAVHKLHEVGRRSIAAGGGKIAQRLISPRTVVGMLHDGQQFDVRVAEFLDVRNQLVGKFAIAEPAIVFLRHAPPGAEMHFVNADGLLQPVFLGALLHPVRVVPGMFVEPRDDRAGVRPQLRAETVRIGLQRQNIVLRARRLRICR